MYRIKKGYSIFINHVVRVLARLVCFFMTFEYRDPSAELRAEPGFITCEVMLSPPYHWAILVNPLFYFCKLNGIQLDLLCVTLLLAINIHSIYLDELWPLGKQVYTVLEVT